MKPKEIRVAILLILKAHKATGTSALKEHTELAQELGFPDDEIINQLDILESEGHVMLGKSFGPSYSCSIEPAGMKYLEEVEEIVEGLQKKRKIGFGSSRAPLC